MKKTFLNLRNTALLLPLSLALMTIGCKEPDTPPIIDIKPVVVYPDSLAGEMKVQFSHTVDGQPLAFETTQYVNAAGNSYKVVEFKYYISNLKLKNTLTGKTFALANSYYLIDPKEQKTTLNLKGIPVNDFNQVVFSIGVDSAANSSTDNVGDLDPNTDMSWGWNTGYKFMNFTGKYDNNLAVVFHIGENINYKTLNFPLSQTLHFQKNKPYTLQIGVNVNELFQNPEKIDFNVVNNVMGGENAKKLANNYANGMFQVQSITQ